ncbi:MAG: THUMP domain-containing protein [Candidatus Diapherotrites archaeon]
MVLENLILIKISPSIFIKSEKTKRYFLRKLRDNVACMLKRSNIKFKGLKAMRQRLILYSDEPEKCIKTLKCVFGIHALAYAWHTSFNDIKELADISCAIFPGHFSKNNSFAIDCSRAGKHGFSSRDVEVLVGESIVKKYGLKVNLSKPSVVLHIDIENNKAYFYFDEQKGFDGLPLGSEGNVAMVFDHHKKNISKNIVCAWMMMRKGCNIYPVKIKKHQNIERDLKILKPWNLNREFMISHFDELDHLVKNERIRALVVPDTDVSKKAFTYYTKFDSEQKLPVFRPLLFCNNAKIKELERIAKTLT